MGTTDGAEDTLGSNEGDWDGLSDGIPEGNLDGTSDAVTVGLMDGCDVILNGFNSVINDSRAGSSTSKRISIRRPLTAVNQNNRLVLNNELILMDFSKYCCITLP